MTRQAGSGCVEHHGVPAGWRRVRRAVGAPIIIRRPPPAVERYRVIRWLRPKEILRIGGREVTISNPRKVYFPETGHTKLDLVRYYLAVADGALRGVRGRPMALKRFVDGAAGEPSSRSAPRTTARTGSGPRS